MTRRAAPPLTREEAIERYGEGNVQECRFCEGWYHGASYPGACFACAVGLEPYAGDV